MARKKEQKSLGAADGFDFSIKPTVPADLSGENITTENLGQNKPAISPLDGRVYSKYYTPTPRLGKQGGVLGHPPVAKEERKIQFSVTCTPAEKESIKAAAAAAGKRLPDFILAAVNEYIENHELK